MKELKKEFTEEIGNLLSNYVSENELNSFIGKFKVSE